MKENTTPRWPTLAAFCAECALARTCERFTLADVTACEYVQAQESINRRLAAEGKVPLGPPMRQWAPADLVVRSKSVRVLRERRRGHRPLNQEGLSRLVKRLIEPYGDAV